MIPPISGQSRGCQRRAQFQNQNCDEDGKHAIGEHAQPLRGCSSVEYDGYPLPCTTIVIVGEGAAKTFWWAVFGMRHLFQNPGELMSWAFSSVPPLADRRGIPVARKLWQPMRVLRSASEARHRIIWQASMRYLGLSVSTPVRPAAERKGETCHHRRCQRP